MPPAADGTAAFRELAAVTKVRLDDVEVRARETRAELAEVRAEAVRLRAVVDELRLALAEARGQKAASLDWRAMLLGGIGASGTVVVILDRIGVL